MNPYVPTVDQLRDAYAFLIWGDQRSVEVARLVSAEGFAAEQGISLGSVHKLLAHMMATQITWLARWRGTSPTRIENHTDYPTLAAIDARWPTVHADLLAFVEAQTPATLAAPLSYRTTAGQPVTLPLGQAMLHVPDHGSYHRGQLNSMARRAGGTPLPIMRYTWVLELSAER
jgi:uncharacterized damage-inducible protein DinB